MPEKDKITDDIVTDDDSQLEPHQLGPLDPENLPPGYHLDKNGCIRHSKGHFVVKGGAAMNPSGRPKTHNFVEKLKRRFGEDSSIIVNELLKIITYDHSKDTYVNKEGKIRRVQFPRVKESDRINAIKLVLAYRYGQPAAQLNVDQNVDIKIDARMHQVAELISKNRENLKVLPGGKEQEVIEAEFEDVEEKDIVDASN